jgi:hypothetical protein
MYRSGKKPLGNFQISYLGSLLLTMWVPFQQRYRYLVRYAGNLEAIFWCPSAHLMFPFLQQNTGTGNITVRGRRLRLESKKIRYPTVGAVPYRI